jgi:glycosyltransferase involved in cell wall biosynthesis
MEKTLTIVASNRNRLDLNSMSSKWFIKTLENQTTKDFELIIADGGSSNIGEIKKFFELFKPFNVSIVEHRLGEKFERALLNNVGIRNSKTPYIMTTDVDMLFATRFIETVIDNLAPNRFVESRTLYLKPEIVKKIYNEDIDFINDVDACKVGRIKKRTTAGGCQCAHITQWEVVRGFDERYVGWGSEDYDLLTRMERSGAKTKWLGESNDSIMLFHQPHAKNYKQDIEEQAQNKKLLAAVLDFRVNESGWGGKKDIVSPRKI